MVTVIASAAIACTRSRMPPWGPAVGEQDDVLLARLRHRQVLVRGVERREDLGAAAGLDARDVVLDARAVARRLHLHVARRAPSRTR